MGADGVGVEEGEADGAEDGDGHGTEEPGAPEPPALSAGCEAHGFADTLGDGDAQLPPLTRGPHEWPYGLKAPL